MTVITDMTQLTRRWERYTYHSPKYVGTVNINAYMTPARRATTGVFDNSRTLCRESYSRGILISSLPALMVLAHKDMYPLWRTYADAPDHIANANGKQKPIE